MPAWRVLPPLVAGVLSIGGCSGSQTAGRADTDLMQGDIVEVRQEFHRGSPESAHSALQGLVDEGNRDSDVLNALAVSAARTGSVPQAISILEELLRLHGGEYEIYYNLGVLYRENGDYRRAANLFARAMNHPEAGIECAAEMALCEVRLGMADETTVETLKGIEATHPAEQWRVWAREQRTLLLSRLNVIE